MCRALPVRLCASRIEALDQSAMDDSAGPPDGKLSQQKPASLRLAVYDTSGGARKALARLEVSAKLDGTCDVKISSESDASAAEIHELLERKRAGKSSQPSQSLTTEETLEKGSAKLKEILIGHGYEVEVLPAGDHTLSFVMDMRTGTMIGTHAPLHDAVASDSDIMARRIFDSLAAKFKKVQDELAAQILDAIAGGSHADALGLICEAYESGNLGFPTTEALLEALQSVNLTAATDDQRQTVLKWRTHAAEALGKSDVSAVAAEELLSGWGHTFNVEQTGELRMILATAAIKRGSKETALMIWRELLDEPRSLSAENRGWAWRNISFALPVDDPEALQAARYSADAFLEAGGKKEAAKSLMQVANHLLHCEPARALSAIDEILPLLDSDALAYRPARAATLHARANRLMKLGRHAEAATDAQAAVNTWRGIMGAECELVSSLYLAAFAAESAGDESANARLKSEADKLAAALGTPRFALGNRLMALSETFNKEAALQLLADAARDGDHDVVASVRYVQAAKDATLSDSGRLMLLEEGLNALEKSGSRSSVVVSLQCAIGNQLMKMSQYKRARDWYEKAIRAEPLGKNAREGLLNCLWKMEAWGEAALFLKSQLALLGEMPGLMFAYGRSMFEAGDMPGAFRALRRAEELAESTSPVKAEARSLAERALALAGTIAPLTQTPDPTLPATLDELDKALEHFASFISGAKRMVFWTKPESSDYVWIEKPERQAQNLLHTFLKARFQERIDVFEEIATGAGRLDIYVQLYGGLAAVIELKMCGFRYSSSYASAGEGQITHYMSNRRSSIGYLVVFDARLKDFASPLTDTPHQDSLTIRTKFVDVRPRVSAKRIKER
jgi:tetratricopeptide (TPR) repeat protein